MCSAEGRRLRTTFSAKMGRGLGNPQRNLMDQAAYGCFPAEGAPDSWQDPPWVCLTAYMRRTRGGFLEADVAYSARRALHGLAVQGLVVTELRLTPLRYLRPREPSTRRALWFRLADDENPFDWLVDPDDVSQLVSDERLNRGLTQRAAAAAAGLHPSTISRIELGRRRPRNSTLERILSLD